MIRVKLLTNLSHGPQAGDFIELDDTSANSLIEKNLAEMVEVTSTEPYYTGNLPDGQPIEPALVETTPETAQETAPPTPDATTDPQNPVDPANQPDQTEEGKKNEEVEQTADGQPVEEQTTGDQTSAPESETNSTDNPQNPVDETTQV